MQTIYKAVLYLTIISGVTGCATSLPRADKISDAESAGFFSSNEKNAVVFFTCGARKQSTIFGEIDGKLSACALEINGKPYKQLRGLNLVGRVELAPGTYQMQGVANDPLAVYVPIKIELKGGEPILVQQNLTIKSGPMGGALSSGFVNSLEWTKNDVLNKVAGMQPVNMTD